MKTKYIYITFVTLILFASCKDNNSFPVDLENRIQGEWVVVPNDLANTFIMYKLDQNRNDCCSVFRFEKSKEFYWHFLNKNNKRNPLSCGNTLMYSEESNWCIDSKTNSIILDKIESNGVDHNREKIKYYIYEFSPDTFTLQRDEILINKCWTD